MSRIKKTAKPEEELVISTKRVPQRPKLKNPIGLKRYDWTEKQKEILDTDFDIMFLHGVSGSSKTSLAVYLALKALNDKKVSDILYIRSAVENSENGLGFLKGDLHEKFSVYGVPFFDKLEELVSKPDIDRLKAEDRIDVQPINFIRGQNWNARFVILDEAQNTPYKDLKTFLTRRGKFTKIIVCADPEQTDLKENKGGGGFSRMLNNLFNENREKGLNAPTDEELDRHKIYQFEFTEEDILRSEFVKFVCKRL